MPTPTPRPTREPLTPALAAQYALEQFTTDNPSGRLVGQPQFLRGKILSLADAYKLANGKPLPADSPLVSRSDRLVWLVVTRGVWLLHIPGGHGDPRQRTPTVLAKDITVPDLWNALIFDAATGETYDQGGIPEPQRAPVGQLPDISLP